MVGMFGPGDDETPRMTHPYTDEPIDPAKQLATMREMDENLIWDGTRYVWKEQHGDDRI